MKTEVTSRRIRDSAASKTRILDAVGALLETEGFGALGINAVARRAGVDKVLIYRYFGGLPELLAAYGESGDFWPDIGEIVGDAPEFLQALPLADRAGFVLTNYARALRTHRITCEILAWESVERNALTNRLEAMRGALSDRMLAAFGDDLEGAPTDGEALVAMLLAAVDYFSIRGRGAASAADADWERLEATIVDVCRLCLAPRD